MKTPIPDLVEKAQEKIEEHPPIVEEIKAEPPKTQPGQVAEEKHKTTEPASENFYESKQIPLKAVVNDPVFEIEEE